MTIDILMPALSPTMEVGTLAKWMVKKGDIIKAGDLLAEIETDKAIMEFEAVDEGTILELSVKEGQTDIKVNSIIAIMEFTLISVCPSFTDNSRIVPSSTASNSIIALSVSISAKRSPALIISPFLTIHFARVPTSIVGERAGIKISIVILCAPGGK